MSYIIYKTNESEFDLDDINCLCVESRIKSNWQWNKKKKNNINIQNGVNMTTNQLLKKYPYDEDVKKLKKLPDGFIKQYIYDIIKGIFPHVIKQIDNQTQKWTMTVVADNREQIDSIEQQFEQQVNSKFNAYISEKLGNPKKYNRIGIKFISTPKGNTYKIETIN